jgi:hypothetical protein
MKKSIALKTIIFLGLNGMGVAPAGVARAFFF